MRCKIPRKTMERLMKQAGAKRISAEAIDIICNWTENMTARISKEAGQIAFHSGRKTIHEADILIAKKRLGL